MSSKQTQKFRLFDMLQSGKPVETAFIASELGIAINSVPVYIFELKKLYKADIESIRTGRKVTAYKLNTVKKIAVPKFRKNAVLDTPKKTATKSVATLADELDSVNNGTVSEKEFDDIRSSLGLDFGSKQNTEY